VHVRHIFLSAIPLFGWTIPRPKLCVSEDRTRTVHVLLITVTVIVCMQIFYSLRTTSVANKMPDLPKEVGWIGLGVMGLPMLRNLLGKMENETQFYVYDVVQKSIDDIVEDGQGRVHACSSSKEVADRSVCYTNRKLSSVSQNHLLTCRSRISSSQWSPKAPTSNPST
jgi:hypothetical protein